MEIDTIRGDMPTSPERMHFDSAGSSITPNVVHDTVLEHLSLEREIGGYAAERAVGDRLTASYASMAKLLGCGPHEIAFLESATRAWDMLAYSLPLRKGGRILTGHSEYVSNFLALRQLATRSGAEITVIPDDDSGQISIAALEKAVGADVDLIAITHVPTSNGLINPAAEIGEIARRNGIPYLLDACQSAGQLDLNVNDIQCDMLTGTGRKFLRGPRGTGFLYVRETLAEQLDPVFVDLRAAEWTSRDTFRFMPGARRFEAWESSIAGRLGLGAAVDYALSVGLAGIEARVRRLAQSLREQLSGIDGVTVQDTGAAKSGIVTFSNAAMPSDKLRQALEARGTATSSANFSQARLDLERRQISDVLRSSVHYFNTDDEISTFVQQVEEILQSA